jgi:hypothetical protein
MCEPQVEDGMHRPRPFPARRFPFTSPRLSVAVHFSFFWKKSSSVLLQNDLFTLFENNHPSSLPKTLEQQQPHVILPMSALGTIEYLMWKSSPEMHSCVSIMSSQS